MKIPPKSQKALIDLYYVKNPVYYKKEITWPGAVGRAGTWLVKHGYAVNLGKTVYSGNCPRMGEVPDAYVQFEITEKGVMEAKKLIDLKNN